MSIACDEMNGIERSLDNVLLPQRVFKTLYKVLKGRGLL